LHINPNNGKLEQDPTTTSQIDQEIMDYSQSCKIPYPGVSLKIKKNVNFLQIYLEIENKYRNLEIFLKFFFREKIDLILNISKLKKS